MPVRPGLRHRAASLTTALVLGASTLAVSGAALVPASADAPGAVQLTSTRPVDGSSIPSFVWSAVPGAANYRVEVYANASLSGAALAVETTTNTSWTPARVLPGGTLGVRVRAQNGGLLGEWTTASFDVDAAPAPLPVVRAGDEVAQPPYDPVVMRWTPVPGATSYEVQVDVGTPAVADWVGAAVRTTKATSFVWPDPQEVNDYSWRVKAKFPNSLESPWSAATGYEVPELAPVTSASCASGVACAPDAATGVPRPDVSLTDVVLDWDPVPGAQRYQVRVSLTQDASRVVETRTVDTTRYSPATTYLNNTYYWQVRPVNAAGKPAPWPDDTRWSRFERRWPLVPTLLHPTGSTADLGDPYGDDVFYQWSPVKHASHYRLDIGTDANFSRYESCTTRSTTYVPGHATDKCFPHDGQPTYWRVFALDAGSNQLGLVSRTGAFSHRSGATTLVSPAPGAQVSVPTLRWAPVQDTEEYKVLITDEGGSPLETRVTAALSYTPTSKLEVGETYRWSVTAMDSLNKESVRPLFGRAFTLTGPAVTSAPLALHPVTEEDQPVGARMPNLSWEPHPDADHYRVTVVSPSGVVYPPTTVKMSNEPLRFPSATEWGTNVLAPGRYEWFVDAYDDKGTRIATSPRTGTYTISPLRGAPDSDVTGTRIALDGLSVDADRTCSEPIESGAQTSSCPVAPSTPVLDWTPVEGAGGYIVYLAEDPDMTNIVSVMSADGEATQNSRWNPRAALPDNESGQSYYWYVRPCVSVAPRLGCAEDPKGKLDVAQDAFRKRSAVVEVTAPADDHAYADEVTFSWRDYRETSAGTRFGTHSSTSDQSAQAYRVQVSTTPTFQVLEHNVVVDQATWTPPTLLTQGEHYWRVQAIDGSGNPLPWSQPRRILRRTPTVNLDPADSGTVESPRHERPQDPETYPRDGQSLTDAGTPFRWRAADFDSSWQVEVYRNDDSVPSLGNRVFSTTTRSTAYTWTELLAPSPRTEAGVAVPYRWRLKRIDASGKETPWSDLGSFTVPERDLVTVAPLNGSAEQPNGPRFVWRGVPGATTYRVELRSLTAGVTAPTAPATPALSWSVPTNIRGGRYEWSVVAIDASGNPIARSAARTFSVSADLAVRTDAVISAPDGAQVDSVLTSSPPVWDVADQSLVTHTYQWLRNGRNISGATAPTYTLTTADADQRISLRVVGRRAGFADGTSTSNEIVGEPADAVVPLVAPTISGTAAYGSTLTATEGQWSGGGAPRFTYQWVRDGADVAGATRRTYKVVGADAGRTLQVRVSATVVGRRPGSATSATVTVAKLSSTTALTSSAAKVKKRKKVTFTVRVAAPGTTAYSGRVRILNGKKAMATLRLRADGTVRWSTRKLAVGKRAMRAVYLGTPTTSGSRSKVVRVRVIR